MTNGRPFAVVFTVVVAAVAVFYLLDEGEVGSPERVVPADVRERPAPAIAPGVERVVPAEAPSDQDETRVREGSAALAVSVRGRVVEAETDLPLAGVPIRMTGPGGVAETVSGVGGAFEIGELSRAVFRITTGRTERHAFVGEEIDVDLSRGSSNDVTLRVTREWFVSGFVVEVGTGRPVPDLSLLATAGGKRRHLATTDGSGRFADAGPVRAGRLTIGASEDRSAGVDRTRSSQDLLDVDVGQDDVTKLRIEFPWNGALEGIVLDERDRPIPHAQVRVFTPHAIELVSPRTRAYAIYERRRTEGYVVRADDFGRFVIRSLPNDRPLLLVASAAGFATNRSAELDPPFSPDRPPVEIRLSAGGRVAGSVVDAEGAPIPKATVLATPKVDLPFLPDPALTDAEGTFVLAGLPAGAYHVDAQLRGNYRETLAGLDVLVKAGHDTDVILRAGASGHRIAGVVVDANGVPLNGPAESLRVRASAVEVPGGRYQPAKECSVGEDGRFELTGLSAARFRVYPLSGSAGDPYDPVEVEAPHEDCRLVWAPPPRVLLILRSVDSVTGEPVPEVDVSARHLSDGRGRMSLSMNTGVDGVARLHVRSGRYEIVVARSGHAPAAEEIDVVGHDGGKLEVTIRLRPGRRVPGVVRDADGRPVPGVSVAVLIEGSGPVHQTLVRTGPDGRFVHESAPQGPGKLCVVTPDYRFHSETVIADGSTVITFDPP